jgi:hypothetical protein
MVIYLRRASRADIARLTSNPESWEQFAFEEGEDRVDMIDLDKAWHALHFMLTDAVYDTEDPLGIIARNEEQFGTDENGFGGFAVISPDRMKAFDSALRKLDDRSLASRYDPAAMAANDIYFADVFVDDGEDALEYVMQGVPDLREFAARCASQGDGALRILG